MLIGLGILIVLLILFRSEARNALFYGDLPYKPLIADDNKNTLPKTPKSNVLIDSVFGLAIFLFGALFLL